MIVIDARPSLAGIVRAEQSAFGRLDHRVHSPGAGHGHAYAPKNARRQAMSLEMLPREPAIRRFVETGARAAAREIPRLTAHLPEGREHDVWVLRVECHVDRSGVLILVQHLRPGPSTVGAAEYAALFVGTERVTQPRDQHDVGVLRMDDHGADVPRIAQPHVLPGATRVNRFVYAVAV